MAGYRPGTRRPTPVAAHDGETFTVSACCALTVEVYATGRVVVAHDHGCPGLHPRHSRYAECRAKANVAVGLELHDRLGRPVVVIV